MNDSIETSEDMAMPYKLMTNYAEPSLTVSQDAAANILTLKSLQAAFVIRADGRWERDGVDITDDAAQIRAAALAVLAGLYPHLQLPAIAALEQPEVMGWTDRSLELLEEATSYTSCASWSPSLTQEIQDFLLEKKHPPFLCIKPACGSQCCDCNSAISDATMRRYAIRYAYLRDNDPRFGMPASWLSFKTLDEAVDSSLPTPPKD